MTTTVQTQGNALTYATAEPDAGLTAAIAMSRGDIVDMLRDAGLKGRGGAGFPTGMEWGFCAAEKAGHKYIICTADEGAPGAFKDRVILTDHADLVFEGMTIGGRAIGATLGIVYLRAAYGYLRPHLIEVVKSRRERGLLGHDVMGVEGFDFDIIIALGAGAYVCGEEASLIESLEGFRGEPRNRPPFPVVAGPPGSPTVVDNVETLASVACICARGADWFKGFGTEKSTGYKLFSISGDCDRPGVYEFPRGVSVAELLQEVGGAGAKAVQIGGAGGVCVPARDFARPLASEDIPTGGSVVVIGPQRDILDVAQDFLEFFVEESCGRCTPCRLGISQMLMAVELLKRGECPPQFLANVRALAGTMQVASKCGLGQTSPSAFLSIVEGLGDEVTGALRARDESEGAEMGHPTAPIHRTPLSLQHRRVTTTTDPDDIGAMVSVTIDGVEARVPFGATILDAAKRMGVTIPTLCHHPDLDAAGVCRICVVEVEGQRTLQPACSYPITNRMTIRTHTRKVRLARRHVLELLLSEHRGECRGCERNGNCELQSLVEEYGMSEYPFGHPEGPVAEPDSSSCSVMRDMNKCVRCRRCVRTCIDVHEVGVPEAVGRGGKVRIETFEDMPLGSVVCIDCGQCVGRCPTGALRARDEMDAQDA